MWCMVTRPIWIQCVVSILVHPLLIMLYQGPCRTLQGPKSPWRPHDSWYCPTHPDCFRTTSSRELLSDSSCTRPISFLMHIYGLSYKCLSPQDIPNHRPRRHRLPLHHVVGPSQGNRGLVPRHSGMSAAEGLKRLASDYLHSPDSHVDRLRLKRKRSGGYKVLILLEIDD